MSIVNDFKAIREAADKLSSDIFGGPRERMHDCPVCDKYSYNDEDDNPVENDGVVRCDYCGGINEPKRVSEKKLIKDGFMPPPANCNVCQDQGYQIKQTLNGPVPVPCGCPAGAKWGQNQPQQAPKSLGIGQAACGQKAANPVPTKKRGY